MFIERVRIARRDGPALPARSADTVAHPRDDMAAADGADQNVPEAGGERGVSIVGVWREGRNRRAIEFFFSSTHNNGTDVPFRLAALRLIRDVFTARREPRCGWHGG